MTLLAPNYISTSSSYVTFAFSDGDGYADITVLNMLFNSALDGRSACYLAYDRSGDVLYLVNDAGTAISGAPRSSSSTLSNNQCSISLPGTLQVSGNGLQLSFFITFNQTSFGGGKIVYLAARDLEGGNSGWQTMGVLQVPPTTPQYPSVVQDAVQSGTNGSIQLGFTFADFAVSTNLRTMQILINKDLDGRSACYLGYDHLANLLYLVNDAGDALLPAIMPNGPSGSVENSQCRINTSGTKVAESGKLTHFMLDVTFKGGFTGGKLIFGGVQTSAGENSGWDVLNFLTFQ